MMTGQGCLSAMRWVMGVNDEPSTIQIKGEKGNAARIGDEENEP